MILCAVVFALTACSAKQQIGEIFSKLPYGEKSSEEFLTDKNDETDENDEGSDRGSENSSEVEYEEDALVESKNEPQPSESDFTAEETTANKLAGEYILPNSSSAYLNQDDVKNLSAEELRIARNEIYARHGRRFQSQDLQEYFESKDWYHGIIEPSEFKESLLNDFEKRNAELIKDAEEHAPLAANTPTFPEISNLPAAPSKSVIDRYGYENGYSVLSFRTIKGTVKDCGEYYQVDAVYRQGVEAPGNLRDGEKVTLVFNELTGETKTLTYHNERFYPEGVTDYYQAYYCYPASDGKSVVLYQDSEDRVDKPVYEGKLYVRKDATKEIDISKLVEPVTREILDAEFWYNGVYFDEKGYVTRLVSYGD